MGREYGEHDEREGQSPPTNLDFSSDRDEDPQNEFETDGVHNNGRDDECAANEDLSEHETSTFVG